MKNIIKLLYNKITKVNIKRISLTSDLRNVYTFSKYTSLEKYNQTLRLLLLQVKNDLQLTYNDNEEIELSIFQLLNNCDDIDRSVMEFIKLSEEFLCKVDVEPVSKKEFFRTGVLNVLMVNVKRLRFDIKQYFEID